MNEVMKWYLNPIKEHYFDFVGRARRKEYWMFLLINIIISLVLVFIFGLIKLPILANLYSLAILCPALGLGARRLHDVGKSGWFMLISLIPFGVFYVIYLLVQDGEPGVNAYGANPKSFV